MRSGVMRVRKTARARSLALARGLHGTRGRAGHMGWLGFPKNIAQAWGSKSGGWVDSGAHCHLGHSCIWKCAKANFQQCQHMSLASAGSRHGAKDAVCLIFGVELGERYRAHCGVMVCGPRVHVCPRGWGLLGARGRMRLQAGWGQPCPRPFFRKSQRAL